MAALRRRSPEESFWRVGHTAVLVAVILHAIAFQLLYPHGFDRVPWWTWAPLPAGLVAAVPFGSRRARSCLAAAALGAAVAATLQISISLDTPAIEVLLVVILLSWYRDWLPWTIGTAALAAFAVSGDIWPYGASVSNARHIGMFFGIAALAGLGNLAFSWYESQARQVRRALETTRELLSRVGDSSDSATTLPEATQVVLDILCDETWPVGHLFFVKGDSFVDSGVWGAYTTEQYPAFIASIEHSRPVVPFGCSSLAAAVSTATTTLWVSRTAGRGLGPLELSVSSERFRSMSESGLNTLMLCPIVVRGKTVALLELLSPAATRRTPDESETLHLVCDLLARVAEREMYNREIAERQLLLGAIERSVPDTLVVYDLASLKVEHFVTAGSSTSSQAVNGTQVADLFAAADGSRLTKEMLVSLGRGGGPVTMTREPLPPDDERRVHELYCSVETVGERQLGFIYARDISGRLSDLRQLADVTSKAQTLLDVADAGIYDLDPEGLIVYANPQGARLFGYIDSADLHGVALRSLAPFLSEALSGAPQLTAVRSSVGRYTGRVTVGDGSFPVAAAVGWRCDTGSEIRAIVTLSDMRGVERAALLEERHAQALEINDTIVQGLATAVYALELEERTVAGDALQVTLARAKQIVSMLLTQDKSLSGMLRTTAADLPFPRGQAADIPAAPAGTGGPHPHPHTAIEAAE